MPAVTAGSLYTDNFKTDPYWWDSSNPPDTGNPRLPTTVDVLVIGSGYTGLNAAIQTARGGRSTLVVDAEKAGWGCSTRNGGQISTSVKAGFDELAKKYGTDKARAILTEGTQSLRWIGEFIAHENINCDFARVGRFHAAHNRAQFDKLVVAVESPVAGLETDAFVVPQTGQTAELGSEMYYGGVVYPKHCALHPGKYHAALTRLAMSAGATILTRCKVLDIDSGKSGFVVTTANGRVAADKVVVATNGYTGRLTPWQQRRVIPIGSYVIATDEITLAVMQKIMPKNRVISDTRKVVFYYRPSPDRKRIIFGSRVSHNETNPKASAPRLHRELVKIFPAIADVKISHAWTGLVAYTFDTLMHAGNHNGLYFAVGYCGSGVAMASYLGMRVGKQVLGMPAGATAFDHIRFPTRPLYSGNPWFLGASVAFYRWRDRFNI